MIDINTYTGSVVIMKIVTGEQIISQVKNIPEIKAIQLISPVEFEIDCSNILFKHYMEGSDSDTCFISKEYIITVYTPSAEVLAQYLDILDKN